MPDLNSMILSVPRPVARDWAPQDQNLCSDRICFGVSSPTVVPELFAQMYFRMTRGSDQTFGKSEFCQVWKRFLSIWATKAYKKQLDIDSNLHFTFPNS